MMATNERLSRPPIEGVREAPFFMRAVTDDDASGDGLTMDGWGSVFNRLTLIDSYEGRFREQFAPASMKRSFRETPPKIQFDHGRHPLIGSIPIASLRSIGEEVHPEYAPEGGAHIVARIFDNWLMEPLRDALEAEAINGMSHRFSVVRESWTNADGSTIRDERQLFDILDRACLEVWPEDELPIRTIKEARIAEMGPVVWPAYTQTSVGVRSIVIDLGELRRGNVEQRKQLAEAMLIADVASQDQEFEAQRDTTASSAVVVERPVESDDAQRATPKSVGERPSIPRIFTDKQLRMRNQRDRLLSLRSLGERP